VNIQLEESDILEREDARKKRARAFKRQLAKKKPSVNVPMA